MRVIYMTWLMATVAMMAAMASAKPGLIDDLMDGIHEGIDRLQDSAREEFVRIRPWAQRVEAEMKPALERVEQNLGNTFDVMMEHMTPMFHFAHVDRIDGLPMIEHSEDASEDDHEEGSGVTPNRNPFQNFGMNFNQQIDPFRIFGLSFKKWWEGPNVCVDRKVIDESEESEEDEDDGEEKVEAKESDDDETSGGGFLFNMDMSFTSCREDVTFRECTTRTNVNGRKKTVVVRQQCCYGFDRKPGQHGCEEVPMTGLKETMEELGAEEFLQLVESAGMDGMMEDQNVTVFVPSDDAIEDFRHDIEKINAIETDVDAGSGYTAYTIEAVERRKKRELREESPSLKEILGGHMVEGFVDLKSVRDEQMLETMNDMGSKIRMTIYNTYPEKVVMANCARITSKNHYTTNGVVHMLDKVVLPATKSIAEILSTDLQFRTLHDVLKKSDLMKQLSEDGQFTLFAPSDEAFDRLDSKTKSKVLAGNGCSQDIMKHHLLPNVICSGVIENKAKTSNMLEKYLLLERDEDRLTVDGKRITMRDIIAKNGVIHVVDELLVPEAAQSVPDVLEKREMNTLNELIEMAGMKERLEKLSNMTVFAPTEFALSELPKEYLEELKTDKKKLANFLEYHIASPKTCQCDFEDNKLLDTGIEGKKIRLNMYQTMPLSIFPAKIATAQCAKITQRDDEVCGGTIHTIDKVLLPPGGKLVEVIKNNRKYTKFLELLDFSGLENEFNEEGPYTVLVPTDGAFERLDDETRTKIFEDKETAVAVLRHHTLNDMLCCAGITRNFGFFDVSGHRTLNGDVVSIRRSNGGHIYADRAEITACDTVAENGVVHVVDRVLVPAELEPQTKRAQRRNGDSLQMMLFPDPFKILRGRN